MSSADLRTLKNSEVQRRPSVPFRNQDDELEEHNTTFPLWQICYLQLIVLSVEILDFFNQVEIPRSVINEGGLETKKAPFKKEIG